MVSPLWSQPEIHCGAATSWRLPSAWSALWWYGTQLFCPPLRHKHVCVTHSHIISHLRSYTHCGLHHEDLISFCLIAHRMFSPLWAGTHGIMNHLYFALNQGNDRRSEFTERGTENMVLLEETSSSHVQIRALSLLTCWHVCCRGFSFFFVLFSLQAACKISRKIVLKENVPFIMTVGFKDFFPRNVHSQ